MLKACLFGVTQIYLLKNGKEACNTFIMISSLKMPMHFRSDLHGSTL